jgi:hypothetical protein
MKDLFKSSWDKISKHIRNDKVIQIILQMGLAASAMGFVVLLYYLRRKDRYIVTYNNHNIGMLGLVKHDVSQYQTNRKLDTIIKKNFSYPNGITNFGNNCYINVLLQVKYYNLVFIQ